MVEFVNLDKEEYVDEDPIGTVADNLTIDSPDPLIRELLVQKGVSASDGISEVRKRLEVFRKAQTLPTNQALDLVVELSEDAMKSRLQAQYRAREHGLRGGHCDFAASMTAIVAEQLGMRADILQVSDLNLLRKVSREESFRHAFTVITDNTGDRFLADLSFCQFIDPFTGRVRRDSRTNPADPVGGPFANQFIMPGFVKLTDQTLNEYLRLLTVRKDPSDRMTVGAVLKQAPKLDLGITRSEALEHIDVERVRKAELTAQIPQLPKGRFSPLRFLFRK